MTPSPLRPGGKPARLLLILWAEYRAGWRCSHPRRTAAFHRLLALGYIRVKRSGSVLTTPSGRLAARTLEAGS